MQRRPPIGSPHCASQNVQADLVIGDAPVRVGSPGDRSSLGSARVEDPSALQTCPPGIPGGPGTVRPPAATKLSLRERGRVRSKLSTTAFGPTPGRRSAPGALLGTPRRCTSLHVVHVKHNLRYRVGEPVSEAVPSRGFARSARPHIRREAAARATRQVSPLRPCAPRPPRRGRLCKKRDSARRHASPAIGRRARLRPGRPRRSRSTSHAFRTDLRLGDISIARLDSGDYRSRRSDSPKELRP